MEVVHLRAYSVVVKRLAALALLLILTAPSLGQTVGRPLAGSSGFSTALDKRLSDALSRGHVEGLLKNMDDDAVFVDDEQVKTRGEIERYFSEYGSTLTLTFARKEAHKLSGKIGYTTGRYALSGRIVRCDCTVSEEGLYVIVWHLANNTWRMKSLITSPASTRGCGCANSSDFGPPEKSR